MGKYALVYDGHELFPSNEDEVAEGGYGKIYKLKINGLVFVCKRQRQTPTAVEALRVAENLQDCNLVEFVAFDVPPAPNWFHRSAPPRRLWTVMEQLTNDCSNISYADRKPTVPKFCNFIERTLHCLGESSASFPDMKLENCGIAQCGPEGQVEFRLIDLDGINSEVASLPITYKMRFPDNPWHATRYAFAVTAVLYFTSRDQDRAGWYHGDLTEPEKRIWYFKSVLGFRVNRGGHGEILLSLIAQHALPMMLQYTAAPAAPPPEDHYLVVGRQYHRSPVVGDTIAIEEWDYFMTDAADEGANANTPEELLEMPNQWRVLSIEDDTEKTRLWSERARKWPIGRWIMESTLENVETGQTITGVFMEEDAFSLILEEPEPAPPKALREGDTVALAPSFDRWPILKDAADASRAANNYAGYLAVYNDLVAWFNMPNEWKIVSVTDNITIENLSSKAIIDNLPSTEVYSRDGVQ